MRYIIFTFLLTAYLTPLRLSAQDSLKKRSYLGLEATYLNQAFFRQSYLPAITYSRGNHLFLAGPCLTYYSSSAYPPPFWGAQVGYRIFPGGSDKRLNLFFDYNVNILKGEVTHRRGYEVDPGIPYYFSRRTVKTLSIDNYLGVGVHVNIVKNLYINTGLAFDIGFTKEDFSYEHYSGYTNKIPGKIQWMGLNENCLLFKFALGYKFPLKKK